MPRVLSPTFWTQAAERAIKTFAQVFGVFLGAALLKAQTDPAGFDLDWLSSASYSLATALASVLTSMASAAVGPNDSPSLVAVGGRHAAR